MLGGRKVNESLLKIRISNVAFKPKNIKQRLKIANHLFRQRLSKFLGCFLVPPKVKNVINKLRLTALIQLIFSFEKMNMKPEFCNILQHTLELRISL